MDGPLVLRDVSLERDGTPVLTDVTVTFPPGKSTVVVGPSGCGKSVLLKVAAGIILPDRGSVHYRGRDIGRFTRRETLEFRRTTGFVFQDAALWGNKSLYENLALPLQVHRRGISDREISLRIFDYFEQLEFSASPTLRPSQLSIGECKMVAFLRAIIGEPRLLFMDEPTGSIDHAVAERMLGMIRRLKEQGTTMIMVTHSSRLASLVADYVLVLKAGRTIAMGDTGQIVRIRDREVRAVISDILEEAGSYDTDLLDLLSEQGPDEPDEGKIDTPPADGLD